ncbi:MAG: hypothetical protein ISR99_02015 [Parcubacteria group bacterium]|nr:hypothetical protein [Parcubacteria group bacterium]
MLLILGIILKLEITSKPAQDTYPFCINCSVLFTEEKKMGAKMVRDDAYVRRLVKTIAGQIEFDVKDCRGTAPANWGWKIHGIYFNSIKEKVGAMTLGTRAKIAAQGIGLADTGHDGLCRLWDVRRNSRWISGGDSGNDIITCVAATVVIAGLVDYALRELRPTRSEDWGKSPAIGVKNGALPGMDQYDQKIDRSPGGTPTYEAAFGVHQGDDE